MCSRPSISTSAQRRPESEPRRHLDGAAHLPELFGALNEGRSLNPGDTRPDARHDDEGDVNAQRRPESEPRRHLRMSWLNRVQSGGAQRRPESEPRRHAVPVRWRRPGCALNEGRSLNPGDTSTSSVSTPAATSLNEGRSLNPGDTFWLAVCLAWTEAAQRRPESEPRRHWPMTMGASWRAGSAQRRPESEPRRHHPTCSRRSTGWTSLNEGRSLNPGDTSRARALSICCCDAQRRPESEPRRHLPRGAARSPR